MSQQVANVQTALTAYEAEVTADVATLLAGQTTLQASVADLTAKLVAAGQMSPEDAAALTAMQADLVQRTTDLHAKVAPPPDA